MKDILVSVILPFLNREEETINAINSVLVQTHQNFEIILVNDGSTESVKKLEKFIKDNEKIVYLKNNKNLGVSESRNNGIAKAKGKYIAFLDSDDTFLPEKLEKQLKVMEESQKKVSHTSYIRIMDNEETTIKSGKDDGMIAIKLMHQCQIATPTVMILKEFIDENKFKFDREKIYGEDVCFWLTILKDEYLLGIEEPLTIVNAGDESAAYNIDKQILGSKTIVKFLINDEFYSKHDKELAEMANLYVMYVRQKETGEIDEFAKYRGFFQRNIKRTMHTLKKDGLKKTVQMNIKKGKRLVFRR